MVDPRLITPRERLGIIGAFALLWAATTGVLLWNQAEGSHRHTATEGHLRVAQLRGCTRLNVERARNNRNALGQFRGDKAILHYDLTFRTLVIASLKQQTAQVPRTRRQRAATKLFIAKLSTEIDAERASLGVLEWVPLTDCEAATDHPTSYQPPNPVPFLYALPPSEATELIT